MWVIFCPPASGPGSGFRTRIRIWIKSGFGTLIGTDLDLLVDIPESVVYFNNYFFLLLFQKEIKNITYLTLFLWVIFALLDPDPDPDSKYGSGSTDLIKSGSNPDPEHSLSTDLDLLVDIPESVVGVHVELLEQGRVLGKNIL
jgi:hypothetical protein